MQKENFMQSEVKDTREGIEGGNAFLQSFNPPLSEMGKSLVVTKQLCKLIEKRRASNPRCYVCTLVEAAAFMGLYLRLTGCE